MTKKCLPPPSKFVNSKKIKNKNCGTSSAHSFDLYLPNSCPFFIFYGVVCTNFFFLGHGGAWCWWLGCVFSLYFNYFLNTTKQFSYVFGHIFLSLNTDCALFYRLSFYFLISSWFFVNRLFHFGCGFHGLWFFGLLQGY